MHMHKRPHSNCQQKHISILPRKTILQKKGEMKTQKEKKERKGRHPQQIPIIITPERSLSKERKEMLVNRMAALGDVSYWPE